MMLLLIDEKESVKFIILFYLLILNLHVYEYRIKMPNSILKIYLLLNMILI